LAAAATVAAAGMAQVAMIKKQKMPSYDEGGISTTPGTYYSGIPEAHIPLKGGKVPVSMGGTRGAMNSSRPITINYIQQNPTFQDLDTQYKNNAMIAEAISKRVAMELGPGIIANDYMNDGVIRKTFMGN